MRIVITPGEPAGIGPDLVIQLAQRSHPVELVCICDPHLLRQRARQLGLPLTLHDYQPQATASPQPAGHLSVLALPFNQPVTCGQPDTANEPVLLEALQRAVAGCQKGEFAALVTGPLHKAAINAAGIPFTGHTEYLAELCGVEQVVMMLTAPGLRVALATTHLPIKEISAAITAATLERTLRILHHDLQRDFGLANPRVLVCGLNPHAGEAGHLGREEIDTIIPVLQKLQQEGLNLQGPYPADTVFTPRYLQQADAILAMYHDQGLPVLKHLGFGQAINVTLGLPIIRTSVDHGTALDLAGTGQTDTGSLEAALALAISMAQHQAAGAA